MDTNSTFDHKPLDLIWYNPWSKLPLWIEKGRNMDLLHLELQEGSWQPGYNTKASKFAKNTATLSHRMQHQRPWHDKNLGCRFSQIVSGKPVPRARRTKGTPSKKVQCLLTLSQFTKPVLFYLQIPEWSYPLQHAQESHQNNRKAIAWNAWRKGKLFQTQATKQNLFLTLNFPEWTI